MPERSICFIRIRVIDMALVLQSHGIGTDCIEPIALMANVTPEANLAVVWQVEDQRLMSGCVPRCFK